MSPVDLTVYSSYCEYKTMKNETRLHGRLVLIMNNIAKNPCICDKVIWTRKL